MSFETPVLVGHRDTCNPTNLGSRGAKIKSWRPAVAYSHPQLQENPVSKYKNKNKKEIRVLCSKEEWEIWRKIFTSSVPVAMLGLSPGACVALFGLADLWVVELMGAVQWLNLPHYLRDHGLQEVFFSPSFYCKKRNSWLFFYQFFWLRHHISSSLRCLQQVSISFLVFGNGFSV